MCTAFAVGGLFAGLAGTFLAGPLHQPSPALTGLTIFLTFGAGVLVQTTTTSWPARRLLAAGIAPMIAGLCLLVISAWTSPPSLALFLAGGIVAGTGIGAIIRGSLTVVISAASPDDRAGALATFFTAGYAGVSVPVIGVGIITAAPQSPADAADLRRGRRPGDPGRRPHPHPAADSSTASRGRAGPASRHNRNDARRHRARHVHGRAVHGSWHAGIDTSELHGDPLP